MGMPSGFLEGHSSQHGPLLILNWNYKAWNLLTTEELSTLFQACAHGLVNAREIVGFMCLHYLFLGICMITAKTSLFFLVKYLFMQPSPCRQLCSWDPYFIRNFSPICCSWRFLLFYWHLCCLPFNWSDN